MEWYTLGLRKDFLVHKNKTVESFRFVRADISSINNSIENIKTMLLSSESRISAIDNEILNLHKAIEKNAKDINLQQNHNFTIQSKIENFSKSIESTINKIDFLNKSLDNILSKNQQITKKIISHDSSIKKLFALSKAQSTEKKKLSFAFKKYDAEIKKVRNLVNKRLVIKSSSKRIDKKKTKLKNKIVKVLKLKKPLI